MHPSLNLKFFLSFLVLFIFLPLVYCQTIEDSSILNIRTMISVKMKEDSIPGLSIAIVSGNDPIWSEGFGLADLEHNVPAKPNTVYRSASIGKPITATAIMQQVELGKIDPGLSIQTYCPVFPTKKSPITSLQLLSHLSGIRHYGGPVNEEELFSKVHYNNVTDPLDIFKNDTLLFEPGTRQLYSTYGYNVLGCILEGASGLEFMTYLQKNIFDRAGMENTRSDNPYEIVPNRSSGYRISSEGLWEHCEYVDMSNKLPAGGFLTTAEDLVKFARAFMYYKLVNDSTVKLMLTPQHTRDGTVVPYGLGWGLFPGETWYGETEAFHGGGTPGVSGTLYLLPDRKFAVAILMNLEGVNNRVELAANIAKVWLGLGK